MAQSDVESNIPVESGPERDARIHSLYKQLDIKNTGRLDRRALKDGLIRINHPLQNADSFLDNVMRAADLNHDGVIEVPPNLPNNDLCYSTTNSRPLSSRLRKN
jgi:hypothetical protein